MKHALAFAITAAGLTLAGLFGSGLAHANPAVPLCELGGETPCFCPDDNSMRTDPWAMCTATTYEPWRGAAVEQRGQQ